MVVPYVDQLGGMEMQSLQLARNFEENRKQSTFVLTTIRPVDYLKGLVSGNWPSYGVKVYRLPLPGSYGSSVFFFFVFGTIALICLHKKYDIIHCHQLSSSGLLGGMCARLLRKPIVAKAACGGENGDVWNLQRMRLQKVLKALLWRVDLFVCLSSQIENEILEWFGTAPDHIVQFPNFVNIEMFKPSSTKQKTEMRHRLMLRSKLQVLFVGRLDYIKGVDTLLDCWEGVVARCPEAHLVILGTGELRQDLERTRLNCGLRDSVSFRGRVDNVKDYLQAADLLVLPSLAEGMPNVVLEAMACGLPVVATDIPGTREAVENRVTGILVEPRNRQALVSAVVKLLEDSNLREAIGSNGRAQAERRFNLSSIGERYREAYNRLLHNDSVKRYYSSM
ncbi:MAG TPA: hypothetical protein DIU35_13185 [Candidatus Latescibacteria bacterium]|nr:hypothetical protein [Candidatus Latescibacterota bacterium]|tara:strand:+ start:2349 stop:3527 length:1179 start_codon:yes stop_codon:yes gene_type:complete